MENEPVAVRFTLREGVLPGKRIVYEMGVDLGAVLADTRHGCPVEMRDVMAWKQVPLAEVRARVGAEKTDNAYAVLTAQPRGTQVMYLSGPVTGPSN